MCEVLEHVPRPRRLIREARLREAARDAYSKAGARLHGWLDEAETRARDFFGLLLSRAEMDPRFFEPDEETGGCDALDRPAGG